MKFRIGFSADPQEESTRVVPSVPQRSAAPVKSVVQVHFPARNMTLSYYNDLFDLHRGDTVYVDGKLEGLRGRVVNVNRNFRIKLSDYQRVIALADTNVRGTFHLAGSHLVTFDPNTLPYSSVRTWFRAPDKEDEEYSSGHDDDSFFLNDLNGFKASSAIFDRGQKYYAENRVAYLSLNGHLGRAIVEGTAPYEVQFEYDGGQISAFTCDCFCSYPCKHQVAVLLQLKETLEHITKHYADLHSDSNYFAAVSRSAFFSFALDGRESGSITLI